MAWPQNTWRIWGTKRRSDGQNAGWIPGQIWDWKPPWFWDLVSLLDSLHTVTIYRVILSLSFSISPVLKFTGIFLNGTLTANRYLMRKFRQRLGPTPREPWKCENRGMNSFEHLWMKKWSSTREKAGELTIHRWHVNKLRIRSSKRPEEWYNQLTILGRDIWKLLKTYRILQVKKDLFWGGEFRCFHPSPHLLGMIGGASLKLIQTQICQLGVSQNSLSVVSAMFFCFVLYLKFKGFKTDESIGVYKTTSCHFKACWNMY